MKVNADIHGAMLVDNAKMIQPLDCLKVKTSEISIVRHQLWSEELMAQKEAVDEQ